MNTETNLNATQWMAAVQDPSVLVIPNHGLHQPIFPIWDVIVLWVCGEGTGNMQLWQDDGNKNAKWENAKGEQ